MSLINKISQRYFPNDKLEIGSLWSLQQLVFLRLFSYFRTDLTGSSGKPSCQLKYIDQDSKLLSTLLNRFKSVYWSFGQRKTSYNKFLPRPSMNESNVAIGAYCPNIHIYCPASACPLLNSVPLFLPILHM